MNASTPDSQPDRWIVCFDLGGVVVRIARDWTEGCRAAGLDVRDPDRFHEPNIKAKRRELADKYQRGEISCDEFFAGVAQHSAGLYSADEISQVHHAWIIEEYPGVAELVAELNGIANVTTACLSNTNHSHWVRALEGEPPHHVPSRAIGGLTLRLASHNLGLVKPDPAIYAEAQRRFGVPPGRIVFFDDLQDNIDAALDAGWRAVRIDHQGDTASQMRTALLEIGLLHAAM